MQWTVSTCEFTGPHRLLLLQVSGHSTTYITNLTTSWEYLTTLEYEWSVIRGHRHYRWTIWVCINMRFTLVLIVTPETNLLNRRSTDLLPCTDGRPFFRDIQSPPFE
jgi:hypothetical protein